ncbi:MAG: lytic transglycosylase domain-containing protein [Deltaproteobacteria bacterium]|jgi:soluble lytic murein transglycosylase-like protein|nr:lytic transglycosylase domain-containing protein [Deltaproteobacteria bacterium]
MLDNKTESLTGNLSGRGGNLAASQAIVRRPGAAGIARPQSIGGQAQGLASRLAGDPDFEAAMATNRSQNRIISDVLDGPVSNQTQRQLAQLQAMNDKNPVLEDFEKGARAAKGARGKGPFGSASAGADSAADDVTSEPIIRKVTGKLTGPDAGTAAATGIESAADTGSYGNAPAAGLPGAPDTDGGPQAPYIRRGAISLAAGPTILKGQGTGAIFNASRMAAYHQKYGAQLRLPLRSRPDPVALEAAERLPEPPAPLRGPLRAQTDRGLKGSIPAVAAELAKSEGGPSPDVDAAIDKAANALGLDPALIRAVVKAESNFNPKAVSGAGAKGLMQLMPGTAREMGVDDPFNPLQNIWGGARYLKRMLDRHGGNLRKALASYNWGPGNVDRHGAGGNLPRETRRYIEVVTANYNRYKSQVATAEA